MKFRVGNPLRLAFGPLVNRSTGEHPELGLRPSPSETGPAWGCPNRKASDPVVHSACRFYGRTVSIPPSGVDPAGFLSWYGMVGRAVVRHCCGDAARQHPAAAERLLPRRSAATSRVAEEPVLPAALRTRELRDSGWERPQQATHRPGSTGGAEIVQWTTQDRSSGRHSDRAPTIRAHS